MRQTTNRKSSPGNITRAGISNVKKSLTRLYFLVGVAREDRTEKIAKNIEISNIKRNLVLK